MTGADREFAKGQESRPLQTRQKAPQPRDQICINFAHTPGGAKMCGMTKPTTVRTKTVRRSIALPRRLVEEVTELAPPGADQNWNRLVITALEDYASRRRLARFEEAIAAMAADPSIRAETKSINKLFRKTERDGFS